MRNKKLCSLLCVAAITVTSLAQPAYAAESCGIAHEATVEADGEEPDYEVLKTDENGRDLLVRTGDVYVTSEYDDENHRVTTYYSNGPLDGDSCTQ